MKRTARVLCLALTDPLGREAVAVSPSVGPPFETGAGFGMDNCWQPKLGVYFLPLEGLNPNFQKLLVRGVSHGLEEIE